MKLYNTENQYGLISRVLHWIGAAGVIWLYFLGENIEEAKKVDAARDEVRALVEYHMSVGMIFIVFLFARVFWHIAHRQPAKPTQSPFSNALAYGIIWAFLAMIFVQVLTGPLIEWSAMRPVVMFDILSIPSPFPHRVDWLHEGGEYIHAIAPNLFWPLIGLHVAGALKHLFIDRDGVFQRILYWRD